MLPDTKEEKYAAWRNELLDMVGKQICAICTDPAKGSFDINLENPLECGCRCEKTARILEMAWEIDNELTRLANELPPE